MNGQRSLLENRTRRSRLDWYPQDERITVTVTEARRLSGLGRSKIYELIAAGRLDSIVIDRRRLIRVQSLKRLLGAA
jgi:excisionase family DNA binding protein